MKTKFLGLLIVAVFFISSVGIAQPGSRQKEGEMPNHRKAMMMKKHQQATGERQSFLTEEQKESVKQLKLDTAKKVKPLKNELRELKAHQQTLVTADKADLSAINQNIDKMSAAKAKISKIMAAQHQEFRALLTEEQLLKMDMMKARNGKMHHNRGPKMKSGKRGFSPQRG